MARIGRVTRENGRHLGRIKTLQLDISFELVDHPHVQEEGKPDYLVMARAGDGSQVEIGAAWRREIKTGAKTGDTYISILLDDPSFPAPLSVALFKSRDGEGQDIVWNRPRAGSGASNATTTATTGGGGREEPPPHTSDEIPY